VGFIEWWEGVRMRAAEDRYGFRFPPVYRALLEAEHLAGPADVLQATDLEWLPPARIATYKFFLPPAAPLVPFAITARRDEWCWRLDWAEAGEPAVVFRERGGLAVGYAPDFRGFLYRLLLEELSGSWLVEGPDDEPGQVVVRRSVEIAAPHLPAEWAGRLRELAARPWEETEDGTVQTFHRSECEEIVARDLTFLHRDEA
jgi:hypothetical protein